MAGFVCVFLRTNVSLLCDSTTKRKPKEESEKRILDESVAEERDQVGHPVDLDVFVGKSWSV